VTDCLAVLRGEYLAGQQAYFADRGEPSLSRAYEIGRRALKEGLGVLDVAAMHEQALAIHLASTPETERRGAASAAGDFFRELLSPFEMAFRGYREANEELTQLNASLAQQKQALEAANRELESFSYSVSHDLRAPLRSIDGFSNAVLEDCADNLGADGKRYLGYVREAAQQMAQLIDDLLGLARVTRCELHRTGVDLSGIAWRVVQRLKAGDPSRDVEVIIAEGASTAGDARLLAVLLENLVGNAWKFTSKREKARIEFGARTENGRPVYFVRDDGAGFDMEHYAKLFGTFQRLHSSREFEGTGIGLATVQRVVNRHGGRIWAVGAVDGGATFFFTLAAPGPA
jgi:light-regulated signal transduction histidine kinase (bacteriophytochrome)